MKIQKFFLFVFGLCSLLFSHAAFYPVIAHAEEEVETVTQHYSVPVESNRNHVSAANASPCDVIVTLYVYRSQRVKVIYQWTGCTSDMTIDWELVSIQSANGSLTLSDGDGMGNPHNEVWKELKDGDKVSLYTHINGVDYGEVTTKYSSRPWVRAKIHTRTDTSNLQCFKFSGERDPWALFTASDKSYVRHLKAGKWESDWLEGPNQPTVNWRAQFFEDEAMTQKIGDYEFNGIANPCYQPPAICESVNATPANGSALKEDGQSVSVTINARNAVQYRIKNQDGEIVVADSSNTLSFLAKPATHYQIEVFGSGKDAAWISSDACQLEYKTPPPPPPAVCQSLDATPMNGAEIKQEGENVQVTVNALNASQYRVLGPNGEVIVTPSSSNALSFLVKPDTQYQVEVFGSGKDAAWISSDACQLEYQAPSPVLCQSLDASPVHRATIKKEGQTVKVTVKAQNASQYRITGPNGKIVAGSSDSNTFSFFAKPGIIYRFEVIGSGEHAQWVSSKACELLYSEVDEPETAPVCLSIESSIAPNSAISAEGIEVEVTCHALNATLYRIVDENGVEITPPSSDRTMRFHVLPNVTYHVEVANQKHPWSRQANRSCSIRFATAAVQCSLEASHYGDPIGKSRITAWVVDEQQTRQLSQLSINKVVINWDNVGRVTYPTANQRGPWQTNQPFELVSEPEVMDVGFGLYTYEAWVYVQGFAEPAYCTATGHAQDHDNLIPDPGPFAKANPEGKFQRSDKPSRLPTVGQLPFDGGNGSDKVELILWAFEKQGHGTSAKITAIANEGKPIARLGMESVSNYVKFDGIPAREGIVYGFQIGEHGPWSPLFCPKPDSNPTTITVFWGAGGQTWLSDYAAYGDCWWLTAVAALNGWVTVDEKVATYNALQPVIDWNGHQNLVFSLAQDKTTGLGPRMQDKVIGLQAREWQGDLIPTERPQDFDQRIAEFESK